MPIGASCNEPNAEEIEGRPGKVQMSEHYASSGTSIDDRGSEILLKMARPDIYRINAFRMIEIPVTSSPRVISSQMRKLDLMEKLGVTCQMERGFLPLTPAPDSEGRREAHQRLTDPESRLIDELFWFWPLQMGVPEDKDEALMFLKRNDFAGAVSIWKQHEENSSEANVSTHNLAIMYHVLALDMEYVEATQTLSTKQSKQKRSYWEQAFQRWQILMKHEGFWQRLTARIRELDDPRLTTGTARRIRAGLPLVILSINAMLAVQAAQKGNGEEASYHISVMAQSGFDQSAIDEALRRAIAPIRDHIKTICANAENETNMAPEHADNVVRSLIDQTSRLLATIDKLLPEGHATRESAHDEVASRILTSQIAFGNKTDDWRVSLELVEQALPIAVSASVRKRIEENTTIVKNNLERGTCWFCKKRPAVDKAAVEVKMHGDVTRNYTNVQWRHTTIEVPRCKECSSAHEREVLVLVGGAIIGLIVGPVSCSATDNGWLGFGIVVLFAVVGYIIARRTRPEGIKSDDYKNENPAIKELQSKGWGFGEKPSGVQ